MFRVIIVTGIIGGSFGVVRHFLHISFVYFNLYKGASYWTYLNVVKTEFPGF